MVNKKMKKTNKLEKISWKNSKWIDNKGNEVKLEPIGTCIKDTFYTQRQDGEKNILEHLSKLQMKDRAYEKVDAYTELDIDYIPGEKIERILNFYKIQIKWKTKLN
jgi:hypothetical protein